eukprot:364809-Chlamydomonas_euryale.AAC.1
MPVGKPTDVEPRPPTVPSCILARSTLWRRRAIGVAEPSLTLKQSTPWLRRAVCVAEPSFTLARSTPCRRRADRVAQPACLHGAAPPVVQHAEDGSHRRLGGKRGDD